MTGDGAQANIMIGIIGGSGFSDPSALGVEDAKDVEYDTPFGKPSSPLLTGTLCGVPVAVLARHGRRHTILPSAVNYRANVYALHRHGCTHVLVSTACGSLREEYRPGQLVLLDQFIDRTTKRPLTFFDGSCDEFVGICHLPMADPFCGETRGVLREAAKELGITMHDKGTIVTIEGSRFSTRAESHMFRSWGCDVINMTTVPEVTLAKEAGLCYGAVAMCTDYDCWREGEAGVGVGDVMATFRANVSSVVRLFKEAVTRVAARDWAETLQKNKETVTSNVMLPS
ncbi:S-methyl-5'-thioadenosine phosphorylase-like [Amphibalanus amphitrite]|uniref:S-methyl-5'-thioadenosine phosphorylase-like n=1 Tax=Amphibalanus amphitrite TaxID=1232801 RepID=UPI001C91FF21|nr:S-methyl-5'-thioadenosine phosphorylase-like [Amphibalanus amphitrite]XP_043228080.1 S-methyl-5'-thioadenosine phosphorylase-like [Amphibalanus amphitrite]XP_043228081.1 S-methyl-5'-thioadenosine phosphorylase-like [Amphibalanus amphitrite]XP_043228082.1 S-methyl-5'-thioadenosine phosphorylase-like [Amphibalanus amphitrite]XP_043228083.1 S-methyl-5'-thioadenosine phosphorylase-like [Amphibalanus amphitrite]XP_043228084.1 S-methyl-5'-thioadenosine phosphorylase-like [Amphibalanus amphitrite]